MKVVILTAGIGSRLRPLTENITKFLLPVKDKILGEITMNNLIKAGIKEFVFVTGHQSDKLRSFLKKKYPSFKIDFIHNSIYKKTNTAYSLLLAKKYVYGSNFIKIDGDVYFEFSIIKKLVEHPFDNCLLVDSKIHLDKEEVKVVLDNNQNVLEVGKKIDPKRANGESIGIEKIGKKAGKVFFEELQKLMKNEKNYQEYYDDSYTTLVKKGIKFKAIDISGLDWVEVDTFEDYQKLIKLYSKKNSTS